MSPAAATIASCPSSIVKRSLAALGSMLLYCWGAFRGVQARPAKQAKAH